ncbi:hypothetical protein MKW94_015935, partial [Papaver nudicaule]|nr:hypothetical protein [Papaver nudicaule]
YQTRKFIQLLKGRKIQTYQSNKIILILAIIKKRKILKTRDNPVIQQNKEYVGELFITLLIKLDSVKKLWVEGLCANFMDMSQNIARAVGVEQVKKIYKCFKSSLDQMLAFMYGKIQAPKVRGLIFVPDYVPNEEVNNLVNVNLKRSFPFDDHALSSLPCTSPTKKIRCIANSDPTKGTTRPHHEHSNHVPLSAPELLHGSLHHSVVPSEQFHGLEKNPFLLPFSLFPGAYNLNVVYPFLPYGGRGSAHPGYKENPQQDPFLNPYGYK